MAGPIYVDRVQETTTTTGTGAYTLAGAVTGFQSFGAVGNGNTCYYAVTDGIDWEVGIGTYTASGTTLARTSVLASSNGGAAVNWGATTKNIWVDAAAAFFTASLLAASQADMEAATSIAVATTPGRQQFHPSAAKAWCRFDSAGTIAGSYNVSSITDNGVGTWTVNIGTAFSSTGYAGVAMGGYRTSVSGLMYNILSQAAGSFQVSAFNPSGTPTDPTSVNAIEFIAFGDQ